MASFPDERRARLCADGGIPVTDSNLSFRWAIVHDGLMRRSEEPTLDVTRTGTSLVGARPVMIADNSRQ